MERGKVSRRILGVMNIVDIIAKKRDGGELSAEEIHFFVQGIVKGSIADYQASAWLMAVVLRGMTRRETLDLTLAMRDSGETVDLSDIPNGPCLDKHSTGGVGDKTTLVVVPILAAAGVPMLKMSGRGLGFSGGTIDKLESIPGFRTDLSIAEAKSQVERIGAALIGQSPTLAPADKILYALRDVTATVESIPLIASSIMSKKLASGGRRIVLDVKVGKGAFMKTRERAEELARELVAIGKAAGVPTSAVLTRMDEPLGRAVGNALEIYEALATLQNQPTADLRFTRLCLDLAAHGLVMAGKAENLEQGVALADKMLSSEAAAQKLSEILVAQGGPADRGHLISLLPEAPEHHIIHADSAGVVIGIDAEAVGRLSVAMGAGREKKTDAIDPAVGIVLHCKTGEAVEPGTRLATLHLREQDKARIGEFEAALRAAYTFAALEDAPALPDSLVITMIE